jgi:type IV pilus assembly protein PilW
MKKLRSAARRGITLVELLIGTSVSLLALGMAMMSFMAQNEGLQKTQLRRVINGGTRDALLLIEGSLRNAGWGVDPRFAIDVMYKCVSTPCHDKVNGPDELVFLARDAQYRWRANGEPGCGTPGGCYDGHAWQVSSLSTSNPKVVKIALPTGVRLSKGRVLLISCAAGDSPVMVTLSSNVGPGTGAVVDLPIDTLNSVPYNDFNSLQSCHFTVFAGVFQVDRFRYFIDTHNNVPWLMLDPGIDINHNNSIGADDFIPVAKGVEDLQIAYLLTPMGGVTAPDSNTDWIIANEAGAVENPNAGATAPLYTTPINDASRFNLHPANIRSVRLSVTVRSERTDTSRPKGDTGEVLKPRENRNVDVGGGGYLRLTTQSEVFLRNMESRSPFIF